MSKEMASLLIGIGVEIIVTIFGVVVRTMPMPLAIIFGVIGLALILYGLISLIRSKRKNPSASQSVADSSTGRDMIQANAGGDVIINTGSKPEDEYADIEIKPQIAQNLAVLEVINSRADADFTAEAIVVEGVPPHTSYTMCWNSPPHLAHPIKRGGKSTIIVAEKTSAIMGMETPGIVKNGLLIIKIGISGEVERVGATTEELSNTVKENIRYPSMAKLVDDSCTIEITITSTPPLLTPFNNRKYIVKIDHEQGHELLIAPLPELETHIKLDVVKLLLDGKEILRDLEKAIALKDNWDKMGAELKFNIWYKAASKTFQNTEYDQLWFKNKEGLDYRTANKSDYVETCKCGLDRLETIKQLISDKEDSQN